MTLTYELEATRERWQRSTQRIMEVESRVREANGGRLPRGRYDVDKHLTTEARDLVYENPFLWEARKLWQKVDRDVRKARRLRDDPQEIELMEAFNQTLEGGDVPQPE